jgi:SAM-dependent methyltransferase
MQKSLSLEKSNNLIKSKKRVKDYGEVYTPQWLVKDMIALTPASIPDKTVLEPSCGNGNFLIEILSQKLDNSKDIKEAYISLNSLYGIDIQDDNVSETRERLKSLFLDRFPNEDTEKIDKILSKNIVCGNFLDKMIYSNGEPTGNVIWFLKEQLTLL